MTPVRDKYDLVLQLLSSGFQGMVAEDNYTYETRGLGFRV